jgi:hypothetical protein
VLRAELILKDRILKIRIIIAISVRFVGAHSVLKTVPFLRIVIEKKVAEFIVVQYAGKNEPE